jgi:hypothetical protein
VPILFGSFAKRPEHRNRCVIHQDVDSLEFIDRSLHQSDNMLVLGYIATVNGRWPPLSRPFFAGNKLWIGGSDLDILLHQSVFASAALNARRSRNTAVADTRYADPRSTINGIHHQCRRV